MDRDGTPLSDTDGEDVVAVEDRNERSGRSWRGGRIRKRAALACDHCRRRKRKCDGARPSCTLCRESRRECHYQETPQERSDAETGNIQQILRRLAELENLVSSAPHSRFEGGPQSPTTRARQTESVPAELTSAMAEDHNRLFQSLQDPRIPQISPAIQSGGAFSQSSPWPTPIPPQPFRWGTGEGLSHDQSYNGSSQSAMIIPVWHSTTTSGLLQVPIVRDMLGRFPADLFLKIESSRSPCSDPIETRLTYDRTESQSPSSSTEWDFEQLLSSYMSEVNPQYCIFDDDVLHELRSQVDHVGNGGTLSPMMRARLYTVLSLGGLSKAQRTIVKSQENPVAQLMAPCITIAMQEWLKYSGDNLLLPQILYLLALCYGFLCRPLVLAKFLHMAATTMQQFLIRRYSVDSKSASADHETTLRTVWAIFLQECDLLAEYHLPRSGIEHIAETLSYPSCGTPPGKDMLFWLANLSARRLLNRVHHVLYDPPAADGSHFTGPPSSQMQECNGLAPSSPPLPSKTVTQELSHQLHTWYSVLPEVIKPKLDNAAPNAHQATLILRYNASGQIIYRRYLYHICMLSNGSEAADEILHNAKKCLLNCREFLRVAEHRVSTSCGSLDSILHAVLACIVMLTLAAHNPLLAPEVTDIDLLHKSVIAILSDWSSPGSTIEGLLQIAMLLRDKCRMLS